jgi:hypothetical protein
LHDPESRRHARGTRATTRWKAGAANDTLEGGCGDVLMGGAALDLFVFASALQPRGRKKAADTRRAQCLVVARSPSGFQIVSRNRNIRRPPWLRVVR